MYLDGIDSNLRICYDEYIPDSNWPGKSLGLSTYMSFPTKTCGRCAMEAIDE